MEINVTALTKWSRTLFLSVFVVGCVGMDDDGDGDDNGDGDNDDNGDGDDGDKNNGAVRSLSGGDISQSMVSM